MDPAVFDGDLHFPSLAGILGPCGWRGFGRDLQPNCHNTPQMKSAHATFQSDAISDQIRNEAELIRSLGMTGAAFKRWNEMRSAALGDQLKSADIGGCYSSLTKTLRLFLQSVMLGLGAYLVSQNELTPGAMIAGSILMGRALAPIELAIGQWGLVQRARKGWDSLAILLGEIPPEPKKTPLPQPRARLEAQAVNVIPPGQQQASLRAVSFDIKPGSAVGLIGPSSAGKSTLALAITGVWRPAGGKFDWTVRRWTITNLMFWATISGICPSAYNCLMEQLRITLRALIQMLIVKKSLLPRKRLPRMT